MRRHERTASKTTTRRTASRRGTARVLGFAVLAGWLTLAAPGGRSETAGAQAGAADGGGVGGISAGLPAAGLRAASDAQLVAGKAAEEGDADPDRALTLYESVVRRYDAAREAAAEALIRIGEIKRARGDQAGADAAFRRVVESVECSGELKRAAMSASTRATAESGAAMDPMSPELMRRYGLTSATDSGAAGARATEPGAAAMSGPAPEDPRVDGMSPELRKRYGLDREPLVSGAAPKRPTSSTSPEEMIQAARVEDAKHRLELLRAEALQVNTQLRAVERERRVSEGVALTLVPPSMITDPLLLRMLSDLDVATLGVSKAGSDADRSEREAALERSRAAAESYYANTYLKRLEMRTDILSRERNQLAREIDAATGELLELVPPRSAE